MLSSSAIAIGTMGVASPGSVLGLVSVLALMIGLPSDDGGTLGCGARSEVVLYRIDDRTLDELLAGNPELAAGLAAIAAARQAALEARPGRASASASGRRTTAPAARLVQRLFGQR